MSWVDHGFIFIIFICPVQCGLQSNERCIHGEIMLLNYKNKVLYKM